MTALEAREPQDPWAKRALYLSLFILTGLAWETLAWHQGFAHGDESGVLTFLQRVREGMPWRWIILNGSLHKSAVYLVMQAWPGSLWAMSLPGLLALPLETALLFELGKRLAGPRAGFLAVVASLCTAFTLVRARAGLSFSIFPMEWLVMVWLRLHCRKPLAWAAWGALLGLCLFDYEAWAPHVVLFFVFPFLEPLKKEQLLWELGGLAAFLALFLPVDQVMEHLERRRTASLLVPGTGPSPAGWRGLWELVAGGRTIPYLAPYEHGVLPFWALLALPFGAGPWKGRAWIPCLYLAVGIGLVLAGGAAYGLPAHRFVAAWPAMALVAGVGLDRLLRLMPTQRARSLMASALFLACCQQLFVWAEGQMDMDPACHGPIRNMKAAADAAWDHHQRKGLTVVTELHPLKGAQFRYLVGHPLPMPTTGSAEVLAYLPWDYLPGLRDKNVPIETFQEEGGVAPGYLGLLRGGEAAEAVATEQAIRPLMLREQMMSLASQARVEAWLAGHPQATPWARTIAIDYSGFVDVFTGRYGIEKVVRLEKETLVSAAPLIQAARDTALTLPKLSRQMLERARRLDPNNGTVWDLQEADLRRRGQASLADDLHEQALKRAAQGQLLWD